MKVYVLKIITIEDGILPLNDKVYSSHEVAYSHALAAANALLPRLPEGAEITDNAFEGEIRFLLPAGKSNPCIAYAAIIRVLEIEVIDKGSEVESNGTANAS